MPNWMQKSMIVDTCLFKTKTHEIIVNTTSSAFRALMIFSLIPPSIHKENWPLSERLLIILIISKDCNSKFCPDNPGCFIVRSKILKFIISKLEKGKKV